MPGEQPAFGPIVDVGNLPGFDNTLPSPEPIPRNLVVSLKR